MYWYEELIGERWIKIDNTQAACEGNATCSLEYVLAKRREDRYKLYHNVVKEFEVSI